MAAPFGFGFAPTGEADCCTCGAVPCPVTFTCSSNTLPVGWALDLTGLTGTGAPCETFSREFQLLSLVDEFAPAGRVVYACDGIWSTVVGSVACVWYSVWPGRYTVATQASGPIPDDQWAVLEIAGPNEVEYPEIVADCFAGLMATVCARPAVRVSLQFQSGLVRLWVVIENTAFCGDAPTISGSYVSEYVTQPHDYTAASTTLTLVSGESYGCTWPAELTITPNGDTLLAQEATGCIERGCSPTFGDGPYGIIIFDGDVRICLSRSFDPADPLAVPTWLGEGTFTFSCGSKLIRVTIYCDSEAEEPGWKIAIFNLTDDVTVTFPLDVTLDVDGNITALFSETLANICGGAIAVANISAATGTPPAFPCCDLNEAELICMGEVPGLVLDQNFIISDGDTGTANLHVSGSMAWDAVNGKWVGDITWTLTNCAFPGIGPYLWEDCEITCNGSGGFTLTYPAGAVSWNTTGDCGLPISLSFPNVETPVLCDSSTLFVTLDFESVV